MQQTPWSASINAPASIQNSPVSGSLRTLAVRPAADEALPEVYIDLGKNEQIYFKNWLFAVDGSPTIQILISPLSLIPSSVDLWTPPNNYKRTPFLTSKCP